MKVTLIGTGNMGSALAKHLFAARHALTITGRDTPKGEALAKSVGATYLTDAPAKVADVVIVATGYGDAISALRNVGDLAGKVIIDVTNPLTPDYMGLTVGHSTSAAEEIQKAFPSAHVVKAFNTVFAPVLAGGPTLSGATVPVYLAGDDAGAKAAVEELVKSMGFLAVDAGDLKNARYLEPLGGLNIYFGYGGGRGTSIAPAWIGIK